jgi:hypothetical protein
MFNTDNYTIVSTLTLEYMYTIFWERKFKMVDDKRVNEKTLKRSGVN